MLIEIKHKDKNYVLFSHTTKDNSIRITVEEAIRQGVYLTRANLRGANLAYADLRYAILTEADLTGANLEYADLRHTILVNANLIASSLMNSNLSYTNLKHANLALTKLKNANLAYADLRYAILVNSNLSDTCLTGVNLTGANIGYSCMEDAYFKDCILIGTRPIIQIGPIGSRRDVLVCYSTDKGLRFDVGCQRQIDEQTFINRVNNIHNDNDHAKEYLAALAFIKTHAELWS